MPARNGGSQPTISQIRQQKERLRKAVAKFRPRKAERGTVVFVGVTGGRPKNKNNKGWSVYITKTGKKKVLPSLGGIKPKTRREQNLKQNKTLGKALFDFEQKTLAKGLTGKPVVRGRLRGKLGRIVKRDKRGKVVKRKIGGDLFRADEAATLDERQRVYGQARSKIHNGKHDFNNKVVDKLAKAVKDTLESQSSFRSFVIHTMVLIETSLGDYQVIEFRVPIAKRDKVAIDIGGLKNFIRQKFYAFLASQLSILGLVTTGSANHIRSLKDNAGKPETDWVDKRGDQWRGRGKDIVHIRSIQWEIQQA